MKKIFKVILLGFKRITCQHNWKYYGEWAYDKHYVCTKCGKSAYKVEWDAYSWEVEQQLKGDTFE